MVTARTDSVVREPDTTNGYLEATGRILDILANGNSAAISHEVNVIISVLGTSAKINPEVPL